MTPIKAEEDIDSKPLSELNNQNLVVPALLLDHYADMAGVFDDSDLASQCACMLPAVLITIGPTHWPLLRHTYYVLASHRSVCQINWMIRILCHINNRDTLKTMYFSIFQS